MIHVEFKHYGHDDVGVIALDADGVARADNSRDQAFIDSTRVMEPGPTPVTVRDGERYLRALPANFHGAYFWATFYADGKPVTAPWRVSNGGTVPDPAESDWERAKQIVARSKHARWGRPPHGTTVVFYGSKRAADAAQKNLGR